MSRNNYILFILLIASLAGCKKYAQQPFLNAPAYLRVFNDIATYPNFLHAGQITPFLTFIMDPVFDKAGLPDTGYIVGDQLTQRQLYNISYPYDEADINPPAGTPNYEYPGRVHVLAAPAMNGFDLSAWAQIPQGAHRILFVVRPPSDTAYTSLTDIQRAVLIDTTINFQAGGVYTMEAVLENADLNSYGVYVRKEDFMNHTFSPDSIYLSFYNLSVPKPQQATSNLSQYNNWLSDTLPIVATNYAYDYASAGFDTIPGTTNLPSRVVGHFSTAPNYYGVAFPDTSHFFDPQHNIGLYDTKDVNYNGGNGGPNLWAVGGTLPYLALQTMEYSGNVFLMNFNLTPVNFNNLYPTSIQPLTNDLYGSAYFPFMANEGFPNLNLLLYAGTTVSLYPTVNILEAVNDRFYLMQIQKGLK